MQILQRCENRDYCHRVGRHRRATIPGEPSPVMAWLLRWKLMAYMGVVSHGMYMLNTLVLDCLKPIFNSFGPHHPLLQFPIALACTVIAAGARYRFLEHSLS